MTRVVGEHNGWEGNIVEINGSREFIVRARARCFDSSYVLDSGLHPARLCPRFEIKCSQTVFYMHGCGCGTCNDDGRRACPNASDIWEEGRVARVVPAPEPEPSLALRMLWAVGPNTIESTPTTFAANIGALAGPTLAELAPETYAPGLEIPMDLAVTPINDCYVYTGRMNAAGDEYAVFYTYDVPSSGIFNRHHIRRVDLLTGVTLWGVDSVTCDGFFYSPDGTQIAITGLQGAASALAVYNKADMSLVAGTPAINPATRYDGVSWSQLFLFGIEGSIGSDVQYVYDVTDWSVAHTFTLSVEDPGLNAGQRRGGNSLQPKNGSWLSIPINQSAGGVKLHIYDTATWTKQAVSPVLRSTKFWNHAWATDEAGTFVIGGMDFLDTVLARVVSPVTGAEIASIDLEQVQPFLATAIDGGSVVACTAVDVAPAGDYAAIGLYGTPLGSFDRSAYWAIVQTSDWSVVAAGVALAGSDTFPEMDAIDIRNITWGA